MKTLEQSTTDALESMQAMRHQVPALTSRPKPSNAVTVSRVELLQDSPEKIGQVIDILRQCWKTLKLYGSKDGNFEERSDVFIARLGKYEASKVLAAFEKYIDSRNEFPVPADIIGILKGRIYRDAAVYASIQRRKKDGDFITDEEHAYVRKYENQTIDDWE